MSLYPRAEVAGPDASPRVAVRQASGAVSTLSLPKLQDNAADVPIWRR